jgi:hypothetical protein
VFCGFAPGRAQPADAAGWPPVPAAPAVGCFARQLAAVEWPGLLQPPNVRPATASRAAPATPVRVTKYLT